MNKYIWIILVVGMLQLSAAANMTVSASPRQGLANLVAVDYNVSSDHNITSCEIYNPYAITVDVQYFWTKQMSGNEVTGTAIFKKEDSNPMAIKCVTDDFTYVSRDVIVTPLRMIDSLQLMLILLGMFVCIFMFFITPEKGKEVIFGVGAGALFLLFSQLSSAAFYDQISEYAMLMFILKIGLGLIFTFMIFRLLNDDLVGLLQGPGKRVGEGVED